MLLISVIIPTYNEEKSIRRCISSLKAQDYGSFEIIVVDDSTDRTAAIAKKSGCLVFKSKKQGPAQARNIGARKARGSIVAFIDADTIVPPDWLARINEDFARDKKLIGVGGMLRPLDGSFADALMFKINSDLWYRTSAKFGFYQFPGCNCAYRRDAFLKARGFREDLKIAEDTELSMRMKRYGKLWMDPELYVYNSVRRMQKEGYAKMFAKYTRAFANRLLGKEAATSHFRASFD